MADITPIKTEVDTLLYNFQDIEITSPEQYAEASDILKTVQLRAKQIEEKRFSYTRPLDDSKNKIMADFKQVLEPLEKFVSELKVKMIAFAKAEQAKRDQEQREIEAAALKEAKETGQSEIVVPVVNEPVKTTRSSLASTTIRKTWKGKVVDESLVPREYLSVDQVKINAAIRTGVRKIPGVEIAQEENLSQRSW